MAQSDRVLDVGTGNGPVPRLIAELLGDSCPRIDAVDVAAIRPDWWSPAGHPHVRFHAGVSTGELPFGDASFDWLVSQYGFEYGDRSSSLSECRRVLRPGGRVAMVLHHRDSVVCRVGRAELQHYRYLLATDGLLAAAKRVVPYLREAALRGPGAMGGNVAANKARQEYNEAMSGVSRRIGEAAYADALVEARQAVHALICDAATRPAQSTVEKLQRLADELHAAATRLDDLLEHALDEIQVEAIVRTFVPSGDAGLEVRCEPLRQEEGVLGWALRIG